MKDEQKIQEEQYVLPYHYVPQFSDQNFNQVFNFDWGYEYLSYLSFVSQLLKDLPFEQLVDVGCGDGRFLHEIIKTYPHKKLLGIDYSPKAIQFAKVINPNISWIEGNICDPNILGFSPEIITLIETLEHIPPSEIETFLNGIKQHLDPKGYLIITVPSKNLTVTKKHYQHFDAESLEKTLTPHFKIEKLFYINRLSLKQKFLHKIMTNSIFILNHKKLRRALYQHYLKNHLNAKSHNAARLVAICKHS